MCIAWCLCDSGGHCTVLSVPLAVLSNTSVAKLTMVTGNLDFYQVILSFWNFLYLLDQAYYKICKRYIFVVVGMSLFWNTEEVMNAPLLSQ